MPEGWGVSRDLGGHQALLFVSRLEICGRKSRGRKAISSLQWGVEKSSSTTPVGHCPLKPAKRETKYMTDCTAREAGRW